MRTFQFVSFQFCIILGLSLKSLLNILKPILNVHCINKKFDRSFLPLSGIDKKPIKCTFELKCNLLVSSEPMTLNSTNMKIYLYQIFQGLLILKISRVMFYILWFSISSIQKRKVLIWTEWAFCKFYSYALHHVLLKFWSG